MKVKKFAAALLAAILTVSSVPFTSMAEPGNEDGQWWSMETGQFSDCTLYYANGYPIIIEEKGGKTYMHREDDQSDESKWVEIAPANGDRSATVVAGADSSANAASNTGRITMNSGTVGAILGSTGIAGTMDSVEITLNGGTLNDSTVNGGICIVEPTPPNQVSSFNNREDRYVKNGTININGGKVGTFARGTFSYSKVDNLIINVTGGSIGKASTGESLFAGSNGEVGYYELNIEGGTIEGDVSAGQRALVGEYVFNFTGGEIKGGIFPGSTYSDSDNADGTNNWNTWGISSVNYGIANTAAINISGAAKYTDIFASLQNVKKDVDKFNEIYSVSGKALYDTLNPHYQFDNLNTATTITLSAQPQGKPASNYEHCISLTENKVDNVTVVTPPLKIELNKSNADLQLGETMELKATVKQNSIAAATPSNASVVWESSNSSLVSVAADEEDSTKAKVEVIAYDKTALSTVTIKASVAGNEQSLSATCSIKIAEPKLAVSVSPSTIAYDGEALMNVKLTNVKLASSSNAEVRYEAETPAYVDEDGVVTSDGTGAFGKAAVTASVFYGGYEIASGSSEVTIKQPVLKIISDTSVIDLKDKNELYLDVESSYDYDDYEWTVDDTSVAEIAGNGTGSAVLTAKKAGAVSVSVTGLSKGSDMEGAKAVQKITIRDTRKFAWENEPTAPVQLYINNEEKSPSATFKIVNDYAKAAWTLADDTVAKISLSEDGKTAVVTALAAGSTTLTVAAKDAKEELALTILIIDSKANVEVKGGETEVTVPEEVISQMVIPEFNTEGLTEEQKQYIEENKQALEDTVRQAAAETAASIAKNEAAKAIQPTGLDTALREAGILEDGEKVSVYLKQEVKDIQVAAATVVNEDGTVEVKTIVTGMIFEITPHMSSVDENGVKVEGTEQNIADVINNAKKTITLVIPVPAGVTENYAKIQHLGDESIVRIIKTANGNYIRTSVKHFSEFVITFTNETPSSGNEDDSDDSAAVSKSGQWILNETGWWYRYADGTYPKSQWTQLPWNGVNTWYYFDDQGYMATGWKQDGNHIYYLHPIADGNRGYMYTGWHLIDGKWYYFHTTSGSPLGAMAVSTTTPDGYTVGADGVWN